MELKIKDEDEIPEEDIEKSMRMRIHINDFVSQK